MPTNRRLRVANTLLIIVLVISFISNAVQLTGRKELSVRNQSLEKELKGLQELVKKELNPSPASASDIQIGRDILTIPQKLNRRKIQTIFYDKETGDSGWLLIDLASPFDFHTPDMNVILYSQGEGKNPEQVVLPIQSVKAFYNDEKQRFEIPVPKHLSTLCRLRLFHSSGVCWDFTIRNSQLIWEDD